MVINKKARRMAWPMYRAARSGARPRHLPGWLQKRLGALGKSVRQLRASRPLPPARRALVCNSPVSSSPDAAHVHSAPGMRLRSVGQSSRRSARYLLKANLGLYRFFETKKPTSDLSWGTEGSKAVAALIYLLQTPLMLNWYTCPMSCYVY